MKTFNNYYFQLSWSGGMQQTEAFDALPDETQQDIVDANIAEGQAINSATSDANGDKNCN